MVNSIYLVGFVVMSLGVVVTMETGSDSCICDPGNATFIDHFCGSEYGKYQ